MHGLVKSPTAPFYRAEISEITRLLRLQAFCYIITLRRNRRQRVALMVANGSANGKGAPMQQYVKPETEQDEELKTTHASWQERTKSVRIEHAAWLETLLPFAKRLLMAKHRFRSAANSGDEAEALLPYLEKNGITGVEDKDLRSAFYGLAANEAVANEVLKATKSISVRMIWQEVQRQVRAIERGDSDPEPDYSAPDNGDNAPEGEAGGDGKADDREYDQPDYNPCVPATDAILSLGYMWSNPREFEEYLASLDTATRELLAGVNAFEALVDIAAALEDTSEATAEALEPEAKAETEEEEAQS